MHSYEEGYESIEIEDGLIDAAQRIVVEGFIREGEFKTRDAIIDSLEYEVATYLDEVDNEPNIEWIDGVRYCIHLIKNGRF